MWRAFWRFKKDECSGTKEMLSRYVDGRLNAEELAQVEEHLGTCHGCREDLESLRATVMLLHRLPEVMPSRSFAVAPVAPVPGRTAVRSLRLATAGAALLLVLAFAADRTDLFQQNPFSNPQLSPSSQDWGPARTSGEGESYWVVSGVKNNVEARSGTPVELVVPDQTDNLQVAVKCLASANDGILRAYITADSYDVPQVVLSESEEGSAGAGEVEEFTVVYASDAEPSRYATNADATSDIDSIIEGQTGSYLNMLNSDNTELYSFNLSDADQKEFIPAPNHKWLRPLEYSLLGLVAVLGAATLGLWFRQRRRKAAEVN